MLDDECEELVEEPQDLLDNELTCHMRIYFELFIIYNVSELINKKASFSFTVMTGNGIETFYTPVYIIQDNQTEINF